LKQLKIYNTLSRSLEVFEPWNPGIVTIYVCGPTVYDVAHIGHARTYVAFDSVIRFLEQNGYLVKYARNITDVGHLRDTGEDRMIHGAQRLKKHPMEVADKYMMEFFSDMNALGIRRPDIQPRASMHIPDIIEAVEKLIDKGFAYVVDGSVYFDVGKLTDYGKLSRIKPEELVKHRIDPDPRKRNPADFALWKEAAPSYPLSWRSPWGRGFPGWHIECSIMSMKYLGEQIDIHGGGQELIFPHHENEIAQSEALTGKKPFVKYWMHTGELTVGGRGMHRSEGNFITIKEILQKYSRDDVRIFILSAHYRSPLDYTEKAMEQAVENMEKIRNLHDQLTIMLETSIERKTNTQLISQAGNFMEAFNDAMANDFNTPQALSSLLEYVRYVNGLLEESKFPRDITLHLLDTLKKMCRAFGLLEGLESGKRVAEFSDLLRTIIEVRRELRKRGIYDLSDKIRNELAEKGILIEDLKEGERVRIIR